MNDLSRRALWLTATALLPLGLTACDSNDPGPGPSACEALTLDCALQASEVRYDTTGSEVQVTDLGNGVAPRVGTIRWTNDNEYVLNGRVFVNDGQTLEIEPGTIVRGRPGSGERASALIVARGGTIMAEGTAAEPIVMTSLSDDLADPDDQPLGGGQWGGLIVLGRAGLNTTPAELNIEGIPVSEPRGVYGGSNDDDNSGTIRYVSIRYGGTNIGENNEINGLTLGGVGRGTTIEYVEVFSNADDGVEFFGGTVNTKHMVVAFSDDDSFDTDQGYRGLNQYWLAIQRAGDGDNGAEMDGGDADGDVDAQPYSAFKVANATFVGSGQNDQNTGLGRALRIRESSAASYYRSVFTGFDNLLNIEETDDATDVDSRAQLEAGRLVLNGNVFGTFLDGDDAAGSVSQDFVRAYLTNAANANVFAGTEAVVSGLTNGDTEGGINPTSAGQAATPRGTLPADPFFEASTCTGAVCAGNNWIQGWTALSQLGYLD